MPAHVKKLNQTLGQDMLQDTCAIDFPVFIAQGIILMGKVKVYFLCPLMLVVLKIAGLSKKDIQVSGFIHI